MSALLEFGRENQMNQYEEDDQKNQSTKRIKEGDMSRQGDMTQLLLHGHYQAILKKRITKT